MAERPDEAARRWFKRAAREAEAIERRARLEAAGLGGDRLEALLEHVAEALRTETCDHSPRHAAEWLAIHGVDPGPALDALLALGGGCDCEVVLNVAVEPEDGAGAPLRVRAARGPAPPRPTSHEDAHLRWSLPGKPWRADGRPEGALVVLRFGKAAVLRLLDQAPPRGEEAAWCWDRWGQREWLPRGLTDDETRAELERRRERLGYRLSGPDADVVGSGLAATRWRIGSPSRVNVLLWFVLDLPAPRTLELETEHQREQGDLRALREALAGLARR